MHASTPYQPRAKAVACVRPLGAQPVLRLDDVESEIVGDIKGSTSRTPRQRGDSPLAKGRRDRRLAELAALFGDVKRTAREPVRVVGASWLYNLEAYRRLFPGACVATARVVRHRFRHMPLWGQFMSRHGELRESMVGPFRERLRRQSRVEDLDQCFAFRVLSVESPVRDFYGFYGV